MQACKQQAKKISYFLFFLLALGVTSLPAVQRASIVICPETGAVLHESNADAITHPASLTKMMTLYLTFKAIREKRLTVDQKIRVSKHASRQEPTRLGLKPGDTITVKNAILALAIKSANDAAVALAEELGNGSEPYFSQIMTLQAHRLGMQNTVFKNASGLPNKHQITTARDMATLSQSLYKHFPEYFRFFKVQQFVYKGQTHRNHNHLLGKIKGVDGIKTGFINASGFNLAASMVRDNRRIIAVVMGGESIKARDKKMITLLEATHARLTGKKSSQREYPYASIDDLLLTLGSSSNDVASSSNQKRNLKKAVYLSRHGKISTLETKPASLNDLFTEICKEDVSSKKKGNSKQPLKKKKLQKSKPRLTKTPLKKSSKNKTKNKLVYKKTKKKRK